MSSLAATPDDVAPPLKWAGGKRWLAPRLRPLWQAYRERRPAARWVEPFVGNLALPLSLRPAHALLNDPSPHLINFYRWLQRGLIVEIELRYDRALYDRHRRRFNQLIHAGAADSVEAAGLFYYLNRSCFNGLCRFNRRGEFNVPFGRYQQVRYRTDFTSYVAALAGSSFSCGDFSVITLRPDDFVYADPPYDGAFTAYTPGGFSWADQQRLAHWLAGHPGPVVASNQATERILDLYAALGFTIETLSAPRRIAANGDRSPACEMLASRGL